MSAIREREEFTLGEQAELTRTVSVANIIAFAEVSGDTNPVHLDEAYASRSFFGGRIAHGMLGASLVSAVLGTKLPGPGAVYLSQELQFHAPVRPDDTLTARVTVTGWEAARGRVTLRTEVLNQSGVSVLSGEARLVMSTFLRKP